MLSERAVPLHQGGGANPAAATVPQANAKAFCHGDWGSKARQVKPLPLVGRGLGRGLLFNSDQAYAANAAARLRNDTSTDFDAGVSLSEPKVDSGTRTLSSG